MSIIEYTVPGIPGRRSSQGGTSGEKTFIGTNQSLYIRGGFRRWRRVRCFRCGGIDLRED